MRRALAIIAGAVAVRLVFAALIPLVPDETYYWEWSRHLAAGYFDHPPAIALLIRGGTATASLFGGGAGASAFAVRFLPVLAGAAASLAAVLTARDMGGDEAALHAAIAVTVMPLAAAGLVLATPDVPLLFATAVGLFAVVRALGAAPRSLASVVWWALSGFALGAAFGSKYTSILLPAGVAVAMLVRRDLRYRLREPAPWVACLIATTVFVPVLLWNARHGWISFAFQVHHGLGAPSGSPLKREGDLLGAQALLASPILFALMLVTTWRGLRARERDRFLLAVVALCSFGFFVVSALRRPVEPNWPAPAYIAAIPLFAVAQWRMTGRRWRLAAYWFAGAMSAFIYVHAATGRLLPIPARRDPVARGDGYDALAWRAAAAQRLAAARTRTQAWLAADRYQDASEIAFHHPQHPVVFSLNLSGRANEYDLWPGYAQQAKLGDDLVLAVDESRDMHGTVRQLLPYFSSVERGEVVPLARRGDVIALRRLWLLLDWKGGWPRTGVNPARGYTGSRTPAATLTTSGGTHDGATISSAAADTQPGDPRPHSGRRGERAVGEELLGGDARRDHAEGRRDRGRVLPAFSGQGRTASSAR